MIMKRFRKIASSSEGRRNAMKISDISVDAVYTTRERVAEWDIFAYVRGWRDGDVGFSVIEEATYTPDLSECGVFWVSPEAFCQLFKMYLPPLRTGDVDGTYGN